MGKSLIIKGADFSQNGFHYEEQVIDASTLYMQGDVVVTSQNWSDLATASNSLLTGENLQGGFLQGYGSKYCCTAKGDCTDAYKVTVKTLNSLPAQGQFNGYAIILFTDNDGNIKGGLTTAASSPTPSGKTTAEGVVSSFSEFECAVPDGAKKVYSMWWGGVNGANTPFDASTTFEMKIYKRVES